MQHNERTESLFRRYLQNQCTREEIKILLHSFAAGEDETLLKELIRKELENDETYQAYTPDPQLLKAVFQKIEKDIQGPEEKKSLFSVVKRNRWKIAAAASILWLLGAGIFLQYRKNKQDNRTEKMAALPATDIAPGQNNAVLTLADGTTILLDSAADGALAGQAGMQVLKFDGKIVYNKAGAVAGNQPVYNSIATAKGNQYQLVLADGTKVWLNAASTLRFPVAFTGKERRVEVSGEAYFEVAKDPSRPFGVSILSVNGKAGEIEVLGTHFNVNAYDDEQGAKTSLVEGRVKVSSNGITQLLAVGQQAEFSNTGIRIKTDVDMGSIVAWKDGYFSFDNTDLRSLLRQVSRWYDIDVVFNGNVEGETFTGKISRNVPLSKLLKVLALNDVKVRLEGRKLTVFP